MQVCGVRADTTREKPTTCGLSFTTARSQLVIHWIMYIIVQRDQIQNRRFDRR